MNVELMLHNVSALPHNHFCCLNSHALLCCCICIMVACTCHLLLHMPVLHGCVYPLSSRPDHQLLHTTRKLQRQEGGIAGMESMLPMLIIGCYLPLCFAKSEANRVLEGHTFCELALIRGV